MNNSLQTNLNSFLMDVDASPAQNKFSCFRHSFDYPPVKDWKALKERYGDDKEAYKALILQNHLKGSSAFDEVRMNKIHNFWLFIYTPSE